MGNTKEWRDANKDKIRSYEKRTRAKRKENGKALKYQRERRASPDGYVDRFMERAKKRTPDTDLTREFFSGKMERCCFTHHPFTFSDDGDSYQNPTAPSIDRIDSKEGYYSWNTQVVLSCINRMKSDCSQDRFEKLWKELTK